MARWCSWSLLCDFSFFVESKLHTSIGPYMNFPQIQAVNKSNWFTPADAKSEGGCQAFWNKLEKKNLLMIKRGVWFFCTARNALVIMICILLTYLIEPAGSDCHLTSDGCVFTLTGNILPGLPSWQLPVFLSPTDIQTTFSSMVAQHMPGAALIALIAVLQNIAIAKSFGVNSSVKHSFN